MIQFGGQFNGDKAMQHVKGAAWSGILRATVAFWKELQKVLGVPNPKPYTTPAAKGEPPRKRTGNLAASTIYELDKAAMKTRVGLLPQGKYGAFLDAKNHPWFFVTLERMKPVLKSLLEKR